MMPEKIVLSNHDGKTVKSIEVISYTQAVVTFTDGSYICFTARLDDGKPWMATGIAVGTIEKEWQEGDDADEARPKGTQ